MATLRRLQYSTFDMYVKFQHWYIINSEFAANIQPIDTHPSLKPNVIRTNSLYCTVCTRILLSIYYPRGYCGGYTVLPLTHFPNFFPFSYLTANK